MERLSAAEERFERLRKRHGLWLGPSLALALFLSGDDSPQRRLASILVFCGVWWFTEPVALPITALLGASLVVLTGLASAKEAFASFGTPLLFLFMGSFFLAEAMRRQGLGERMARAIIRRAKGRLSLLVALSLAAFVVSLWISNTAATAIILPVAISVARGGDEKFGAALVLSIAYGASVGGVGTPVGTPPNLIGINALREQGVSLNFVQWMKIGLPIGLLMLLVLWVVLALRFSIRPNQPVTISIEDTTPRPWTKGERVVAVVFAFAVAAWVVPGVIEALSGVYPSLVELSNVLKKRLTEEVVALLAAGALFLWPLSNEDGETKRVLSWQEASQIDWGTILLFGGGILLGDLAGKTGLAATVGSAFVEATGAHSLVGITLLCTGVSIVLSEATSNTAAATLMLPLTISLAQAAEVPITIPALGATLGASFGFMLPISTAPNAMAYGTGKVSIRQMASTGILFDLVGFGVIVLGLLVLG